jgi:hypothetical protein
MFVFAVKSLNFLNQRENVSVSIILIFAIAKLYLFRYDIAKVTPKLEKTRFGKLRKITEWTACGEKAPRACEK